MQSIYIRLIFYDRLFWFTQCTLHSILKLFSTCLHFNWVWNMLLILYWLTYLPILFFLILFRNNLCERQDRPTMMLIRRHLLQKSALMRSPPHLPELFKFKPLNDKNETFSACPQYDEKKTTLSNLHQMLWNHYFLNQSVLTQNISVMPLEW